MHPEVKDALGSMLLAFAAPVVPIIAGLSLLAIVYGSLMYGAVGIAFCVVVEACTYIKLQRESTETTSKVVTYSWSLVVIIGIMLLNWKYSV